MPNFFVTNLSTIFKIRIQSYDSWDNIGYKQLFFQAGGGYFGKFGVPLRGGGGVGIISRCPSGENVNEPEGLQMKGKMAREKY